VPEAPGVEVVMLMAGRSPCGRVNSSGGGGGGSMIKKALK